MKNTILCTFIALLSQSLFADERVAFDARKTAVTLEIKFVEVDVFSIDYGNPITTAAPAVLKAGVQNGSPQTIITRSVVIRGGMTREDVQKFEEFIKERDQLKRLLTEMEALIQAPSKP